MAPTLISIMFMMVDGIFAAIKCKVVYNEENNSAGISLLTFSKFLLGNLAEKIFLKCILHVILGYKLNLEIFDSWLISITLTVWYVVFFAPGDGLCYAYLHYAVMKYTLDILTDVSSFRLVFSGVQDLQKIEPISCNIGIYIHSFIVCVFKGNGSELLSLARAAISHSGMNPTSRTLKAGVVAALALASPTLHLSLLGGFNFWIYQILYVVFTPKMLTPLYIGYSIVTACVVSISCLL